MPRRLCRGDSEANVFTGFNLYSLVVSIIGAVILLALVKLVRGN